MKDISFRSWLRTALLAASVLSTVGPALAEEAYSKSSKAEVPAPHEGEASLVATVHKVDTLTLTMEVITGVGLAVRMVRFAVAPDCQIAVAGAPAPLQAVDPGHVVRVRYRTIAPVWQEAVKRVATSIERLDFGLMGDAR